MPSYRAGSAYIAVSPNFKGFQRTLASEVQKLKPVKVPVEYDTKNPVIPPLKPQKVPVTFDLKGGSFEQKLRAQVRAASAAMGDIEIGAATSEAEQKIRDLKAELLSLSGKRIGVDISADAALASIANLQAELTVLGERSPNIQVEVDAAAATGHLAEVLAMADVVGARTPTVDVEADTGAAQGKLALLMAEITALEFAHPIITIGIAAAPLAAPLAAGLAGGAAGLAGIGAGLAGGAVAAGIGAIALKQAVAGQKAVTAATDARKAAVQGVTTAEQSLASAEASANAAQVSAARGIADAERGLADARRNGAQAVASAEQSLAEARRSGARAIAAAEQSLADARRSATRANEQAAAQVASAQQQLVDANKQVRDSEKAVHQARAQAVRDLKDLRAQVRQNALDLKAALFGAQDANAKLADIETNVFASSNDVARVRLEAAQAEQKVGDARRKSARDSADLAKAERTNGASLGGVKAAQQQLAQAREAQAQARQQLTDARKQAAQARADGAREVARAERALAQTRVDAAAQVAKAQQSLAQTRANAARSVADAERGLARARADGARQVAQAQQQVAEAHRRVAAAQAKLAAADAARAKALAALTPAQRRLLAGMHELHKAWDGFMRAIDKPLAGAGLAAMDTLKKALPLLAIFLKPVYRGLRDMFRTLGSGLGSKGAKQTARTFGVFSGSILRDAGKGIKFFIQAIGNLLGAFMPLSKDMSGGMVKMMKKFRNWTEDLGKSKGFKDFIAYIKDNGPKLLSIFGNIIKVFINLGKALAPLGSLVLTGLQKAFDWLASLSPGQLIALAAAVTILWAALTGGTIAIVAAVIAVGAGLVYAYKHVKWFRVAVNKVWHAVAKIFTWTWEHVIKPALKGLWWFLKHVVFPVLKWLWEKVVKPVFKAIGTAIKWAWEHVIKPVFKGLWWFLTHVVFPVLKWLWNKVVKPVFGWIGDKIRGVWNNFIKPALSALWHFLTDTLFPILRAFWNKVVKPVFGWIGGRIKDVWNNVIKPAFSALKTFIGTTLPNAFTNGVAAIGKVWNGIKRLAAAPVNFIIDTVYNNGIRKVINAIPGVTDLKPLSKVSWGSDSGGGGMSSASNGGATGRFAGGGVLPGYTPGRDVHQFTSRTGGRLMLSGGEAIMRPEWTRAVGGARAVARMNKAARAGRHPAEAYASGGVFANPDAKTYIDGMAISRIAAAQVALARQVSGIRIYMMQGGYGGNHIAASGTSHNYPGVGDFGPGSTALEKVMRQVGFAAWARNVPGRSQVGSGAHVHGVSLLDPGDASSPQVYGSWVNHGNGLSGANNDPAPHYAWLPNLRERLGAMNLSALGGGGDGKGGGGGFFGVIKTITGLIGDIKKWVGQLSKMGGWAGLIKQMVGGVMGSLRTWVNGKIPGPGPIPSIFDDGGQLQQGLTLAYHGARKPDKVLTDAQWNDIHRLATSGSSGPARFDLYDSNNQLIGAMQGIARSAVNGHAEFAGARTAAGMR